MAVTGVALGVLLLALGPVGAAGAASARLPDLGMAPLQDFRIDRSTGKRLLRFTTTIVNVGVGPFELVGRRSTTTYSRMTVWQRLYNDDGTRAAARTAATMTYSGDGHDHWHVDHLERYTIHRMGAGRELGRGAKVGFCFFDTAPYRPSLPGAPGSPVYPGCGTAQSREVTMGLSVGWGDVYPWYFAYQWIDISGFPAGDYLVRAQADPRSQFTETTTANNFTWTKVRISDNDQVTVLEQGPAA